MCVMLNELLWADYNFDPELSEPMAEAWWNNAFVNDFEDRPTVEYHRWGYYDDGDLQCRSKIRYRPPFRNGQ